MKLLLIIVFIFICCDAFTQSSNDISKMNPELFFKKYQDQYLSYGRTNTDVKKEMPLYIHPNTKDNKIYTAKLDRMPCVIPNQNEIPFMPNAWTGKLSEMSIDRMPNPADPKIYNR